MSKAIRDAYGDSLLKYGKENLNVVALDADVSSSTKSGVFGAAFPDRFFNVGISELNMVSMAAGLSTTGKIPFVNTFAVFISTMGLIAARGLISYTNLNVKLMGAYGGMSDAFDGPSHHSIEDMAIMRSLPNFRVFCVSDEVQTDWMVKAAIENEGPMYVRLSRDAAPVLYNEDTKFEIGKGLVVREGKNATIIACGVMVSKALEAAEILSAKGIDVKVVDMFTIKPIDKELIIKSAAETGAIVTTEEHTIMGGLGSAVAEVLVSNSCNVPVEFVGLNDCYGETGPYAKLLEKYGLDGKAIAAKVEKAISRK
jgi:transketolase